MGAGFPQPAALRHQVPVSVEVVPATPGGQPPCLGQTQRAVSVVAGAPEAVAPHPMFATAGAPPLQVFVPVHCPHRVPTLPGVEHIDPISVFNMMRDRKCVLVDLRNEDRAAGIIEGAVHIPAIAHGASSFPAMLPRLLQQWVREHMVIFTCQYSAHRAPQCANWYRQSTGPRQRVGILAGGFRGWEALGLPVSSLAKGESAHAADEAALRIGTVFVQATAHPGAQIQQAHGYPQGQPLPHPPLPSGSVAPAAAPTMVPRRPYVPPDCPNRVPTLPNVEHLEPMVVHELLKTSACLLVDLRGADRKAGLIEGAIHEPAIDTTPFPKKLEKLVHVWANHGLVVFTCQYSAHRAPQCANWYRQRNHPQQRVAILSGGFRGWESEGLPVQQLATGDEAQAADELATRLGTQFTADGNNHEAAHGDKANSWADGTRAATRPGAVASGASGQAMPAAAAPPRIRASDRLGTSGRLHKAAYVTTQDVVPATPSLLRNTGPAASNLQQQELAKQQQQQQPLQQTQQRLQPQPQQQAANKPKIAQTAPHVPNVVPTKENVENLDPKAVHDLLKQSKCLLVDLRGEDRAAGLIEGAVHEPAIDAVPFPSKVPGLAQRWSDQSLVVFTCQYSAHRAPQCANWYREHARPQQRVGILAGGFRGWEALGLPVQQLATGEEAQAADELAVRLGAEFTEGCIPAAVPGGGFCMPGKPH